MRVLVPQDANGYQMHNNVPLTENRLKWNFQISMLRNFSCVCIFKLYALINGGKKNLKFDIILFSVYCKIGHVKYVNYATAHRWSISLVELHFKCQKYVIFFPSATYFIEINIFQRIFSRLVVKILTYNDLIFIA